MKWAVLFALCVVLTAQTGSKTLVEKIYLPRCNGSWYIDTQGSDDSADWAEMRCNDYSDETPDVDLP